MDPTGTATPILRIQPLTAYQGSGRHAPPPFIQGQLLQGTVSGKGAPNQFTIDIGGRQVLAESTAPLQVGQKLDLQVATLSPQVELQIVRSDPVNRMIGNAIHLVGQQTDTFPALAALAEKSAQLPHLSANAKQTLLFYGATLATPATGAPAPRDQLLAQLLSRTLNLLTTPANTSSAPLQAEVATLLQQLALTAPLNPTASQQAGALAALFLEAAGGQASSGSAPAMAAAAAALTAAHDQTALLQQIKTAGGVEQLIANLISQIPPLLQEPAAPPTTDPLRQLATFLLTQTSQGSPIQPPALDGAQLAEVLARLGTNMERLLAGNQAEKAGQTLKHALLELLPQLPVSDSGHEQANQMVKSIELFQLLQIRLANEALLFLPLPLPFLDQGYLLVDRDQGNRGSEEEADSGGTAQQRFELHLQLEGLGNLQIDLFQERGGVAIKFLAEDAERARFLANFREELGQWLTAVDLESAQFLVGAREPVKSLLAKIMDGATGMVDTRA